MTTFIDEPPVYKHFCKICKKGFMCGRALGGHMRAHGIGDESGHADDDDPASDWEGGKSPPNKRMYALRTNPNRLKSCRVCENCGKEFSSWKSFLEHGKCSTGAAAGVESLVSSPGSEDEDGTRRGYNWSKGKRTRRVQVDNMLSEEEDLAHCLVMLSNAQVDPFIVDTEESCASASKEERRNSVCINVPPMPNRFSSDHKAKGIARGGMFECKACKKVFTSHQALGGHRASHKKVKGCFAARQDELDETIMDEDVITTDEYSFMSKSTAIVPSASESAPQLSLGFSYKRKSKVHECTICHRIFSSGQALGGHKRCHWLTSSTSDASAVVKFPHFQDIHQKPMLNLGPLDLNLPASFDDRQDQKKLLSLEVAADIYRQQWEDVQAKTDNDSHHNHHHIDDDNDNVVATLPSVDDEADSKLKLAKLSDLKDVNMGGGSSQWLQVGIGSSSNVGADP